MHPLGTGAPLASYEAGIMAPHYETSNIYQPRWWVLTSCAYATAFHTQANYRLRLRRPSSRANGEDIFEWRFIPTKATTYPCCAFGRTTK